MSFVTSSIIELNIGPRSSMYLCACFFCKYLSFSGMTTVLPFVNLRSNFNVSAEKAACLAPLHSVPL